MAQMVERVLGKDEVTGSIPVSSSRKKEQADGLLFFSTNSTHIGWNKSLRDEIPCGDEIRLDGGWVDLISSKSTTWISSAPADFILASARISLKHRSVIADNQPPQSLFFMKFQHNLTKGLCCVHFDW